MTPYELSILLHYYTRPGDHPDVVANPPIWRPTVSRFLADDLLTTASSNEYQATYALTERGMFYIDAIQRLPLPVHRWEIPQSSNAVDPHVR